jgi:alkylhydroperoxidase/carboxymuconolactone decarboxylase family protein YurZ
LRSACRGRAPVGEGAPNGIARDRLGRESEGGVRSHARKALAEGIEREAIRQVALLAISTGGYPAAMAAFGWINEVLDQEG